MEDPYSPSTSIRKLLRQCRNNLFRGKGLVYFCTKLVQKFAIGAKIRQILTWKTKSLSLFPDFSSPGDITADRKFTLENLLSEYLARPFSRAQSGA